jgi:hypothetical protein
MSQKCPVVCSSALNEGDLFAAASAYRNASGPANAHSGNLIIAAAGAQDELVYASVYRCCEGAVHRQRLSTRAQWLS